MQIFHNPNFDFVRWRWHAIALSWLVVLAGLLVIWQRGMPLGVEFSGGTIVIVKFDQAPDVQRVRAALDQALPGVGRDALVQTYGDPSANQAMIRVPTVGAESGASLSQTADTVMAALNTAGLGAQSPAIGADIVGPSVGRQLARQGILATVLALSGILLYVALRFRFSFAVGAVVATIHDLLVTMAFLAFFRYELSLNVIAAVLTITGYSVNDTIVIFDRVRENMRGSRRDSLAQVVNLSVNQTLGRTVLTAGTALLSALALYLFGGEVLRGFAFTMLVGIVTGTYSSVFIAAGIAIIWQGKKTLAPAAVGAAVPARTPTPRRGSRPDGGSPEFRLAVVKLLTAALLGIVQGLTEFLPVSSSAHLILARLFFGWEAPEFGLAFDVALHIGTLVAICTFFHADVLGMIRALPSLFSPVPSAAGRLMRLIAVGTVPAVIVGLLFTNYIETTLRAPAVAATMLAVGAVLMLVAERAAPRTRDEGTLTYADALMIGMAQASALMPGVSRSGSTIAIAMLLGIRRDSAARFTFLLAIPAIVAAAGKEAIELRTLQPDAELLTLFAVGAIVSGLVGYVTIRYFLRFLATNSLDGFAYYRIGLAALTFAWLFAG